MSQHPLLIFVHIPKTAGRSLLHILSRQFSVDQCQYIYPDENSLVPSLEELTGSQRDQLQLLSGHFAFGLHREFSQESRYITFLRDPVARSISLYYQFRRNKDAHNVFHIEALKRPFDDFVHFYLGELGRVNQMTVQISGYRDYFSNNHYREPIPLPPPPEDMLEVAKQNLTTHFSVVGVTERFDESLVLLKNHFGWQNIYYTNRNVTANADKVRPSPETLAFIKQHNSLDIELYNFARELLDKQIEQQGPTFQQDVASFQRRNRVLGSGFAVTRIRNLYGNLPQPLRTRLKRLLLRL